MEQFTLRVSICVCINQKGLVYNVTYSLTIPSAFVFEQTLQIISRTGNTQLCYAGYPTWNFGSYLARPPVGNGEDVGIDWRTRLRNDEVWQYTWGVAGGGYPTLVVQNNAPAGSCSKWIVKVLIERSRDTLITGSTNTQVPPLVTLPAQQMPGAWVQMMVLSVALALKLEP